MHVTFLYKFQFCGSQRDQSSNISFNADFFFLQNTIKYFVLFLTLTSYKMKE